MKPGTSERVKQKRKRKTHLECSVVTVFGVTAVRGGDGGCQMHRLNAQTKRWWNEMGPHGKVNGLVGLLNNTVGRFKVRRHVPVS